jgi:hypothetical protein
MKAIIHGVKPLMLMDEGDHPWGKAAHADG